MNEFENDIQNDTIDVDAVSDKKFVHIDKSKRIFDIVYLALCSAFMLIMWCTGYNFLPLIANVLAIVAGVLIFARVLAKSNVVYIELEKLFVCRLARQGQILVLSKFSLEAVVVVVEIFVVSCVLFVVNPIVDGFGNEFAVLDAHKLIVFNGRKEDLSVRFSEAKSSTRKKRNPSANTTVSQSKSLALQL